MVGDSLKMRCRRSLIRKLMMTKSASGSIQRRWRQRCSLLQQVKSSKHPMGFSKIPDRVWIRHSAFLTERNKHQHFENLG